MWPQIRSHGGPAASRRASFPIWRRLAIGDGPDERRSRLEEEGRAHFQCNAALIVIPHGSAALDDDALLSKYGWTQSLPDRGIIGVIMTASLATAYKVVRFVLVLVLCVRASCGKTACYMRCRAVPYRSEACRSADRRFHKLPCASYAMGI